MPKLWRNLIIEVLAVSAISAFWQVSAFCHFGILPLYKGFRLSATDQTGFGKQP